MVRSLLLFLWLLILSRCSLAGYKIKSITQDTNGNIDARLDLLSPTSTYGPDIKELQLTVSYESQDRLRVHITDSSSPRWEVPASLVPRLPPTKNGSASVSKLQFSYTRDPFTFAILRRSSQELLFSSTPGLTFKDQYLEISTTLPSNASLYGLGESTRTAGFRLVPDSTYTLWASDTPSRETNKNLYASWPFYLDARLSGDSHGVFLLNSNAMDVELAEERLTYKAVGGVLDFSFFAGPSPLEVVQQLTDMVGKPAPMPYWSLGFHQCRYGYKNVEELQDVVEKYKSARIPLEVMWSDIDYMDAFKDFTLDPINYPQSKMDDFVKQLHANDQKYVIIIDPGIKVERNYSSYERAKALEIFVKDLHGEPYLAQVWPGPVHFPDFLHPKTASYWTSEISNFHKILPFDGLWIDMNEASNFCTGVSCLLPPNVTKPCLTTCCLICTENSISKWDNPPFAVNNNAVRNRIGSKTMAASAAHHGGVLEYDAHNLYGLSEAIATSSALKSVLKTRPFMLSRSTFVGSGRVTAHWSGDNGATWDDLRYSIVSVLNSGLVGIPMVGADICGFLGNTTEELCNRWIQAGAFYPFSRNHNGFNAVSQELYLWKSVTQSARTVLSLRYRLLPHLYTLFYEACSKGSPVARPVFFAFPKDPAALGVETQFMLGSSILVSPVLVEGARDLQAYFPKGNWYSLFNYSQVILSPGSTFILPAPLDSTNVHVRGGSILAMQDAAMTTAAARKTAFTLLVAFPGEEEDDKLNASGSVFLDSGEDLEMKLEQGSATLVEFAAKKVGNRLSVKSRVSYGEFALQQKWIISKVVVLGLGSFALEKQQQELVNGKTLLPQSADHVEEVNELNLPLGKPFHISLKMASYQ
ncbi:alpha-xylosidase 1-like [Selaginella moellendorffii]|uniref:alpha-xylosidase 1-like n=1 Tax=Selaginella moellendorffii TaxID=88036 RepID=UPI000D1C8E6B|nr:alpha-xylosidase 1-like [Selaginella moellendorffii]|eukprot:XP_024517858.1 alpha-xylosidase 1-like [Selaginella moellendorffii]